MSRMKLLLIAALAGCATSVWAAGGVIYGGPANYLGPGVHYVPRIPYPQYGPADGALYLDGAEACFRMGRCSTLDMDRFQGRPNRLLRLAPLPPQDPAYGIGNAPLNSKTPTPEENIVPAYREASQVRPEYEEAGKPSDR
jgi:hypothetical protein